MSLAFQKLLSTTSTSSPVTSTPSPDQCPWALEQTPILVQQCIFSVCSIASLIASAFLAYTCLTKLRVHMHKLLVQQLLALGVADMLLASWTSWTDVAQVLGAKQVQWCGWYTGIQRFFQVNSMLLSLSLALGLILSLLRFRDSLKWLRWMPLMVIPFSIILNLGYIIRPSEYRPNNVFAVSACVSVEGTGIAFGMEVICVFVIELLLAAFCFWRLRGSAPDSVLRRSMKTASRYLFAFFISYGLYALLKFVDIVTEGGVGNAAGAKGKWDCANYTFHVVKDVFYTLNGVFNFWAFRSHVQRAAGRTVEVVTPVLQSHAPRNDLNVGFRAEESLEEIFEFRVVPKGMSRQTTPDQSEDLSSSGASSLTDDNATRPPVVRHDDSSKSWTEMVLPTCQDTGRIEEPARNGVCCVQ